MEEAAHACAVVASASESAGPVRPSPETSGVAAPVSPFPLPRATTILSAATIDGVLLSLSPASALTGAGTDKPLVTRTQSDVAIRSCCALEYPDARRVTGTDSQAADHPIKHRRRSGFATFGKRAPLYEKTHDGFFDVFGLLGVPMVAAFLFSGWAVLTQAFVQVYPNYFANELMNTTDLDNGEFWLLPETDTAPKVIATLLLVIFACWHWLLALLMVFLHHKLIPTPPRKKQPRQPTLRSDAVLPAKPVRTADDNCKSESDHAGQDLGKQTRLQAQRQRLATSTALLYGKFAHIDGSYHAYYNVFFDIPKLTFQSLTLVEYLRKGFPIPMIAFYSAMLSFNWLISFYRFQRTSIDHAMIVPRLFYLFDLFFAVFAPGIVLVYARSNFHFDYDLWQTRIEASPAGTFDRIARFVADPTQLSMFYGGFYHVLLKSISSIVVKCGLLFISNYKWLKIVVFLISTNHARQRQLEIPHTRKQAKQSRRHLFCGLLLFIFFGLLLFIFFGLLLLVYTIVAIHSSRSSCAPYPHCIVASYKWYAGESGCPCLTYINQRTDPRTFAEWVTPPDVSEELALVAQEGQLQTIQLINRALPTLPDAMKRCTELEILILIYTKTVNLPDWTKEFTKLQYLHVEGDFTGRSLKNLDDDLFSKMTSIRFIHTGNIPLITTYPSLKGLKKLQYLTIAIANSLQELPNLDDTVSLRTLSILEAFHVKRLPSLRALTKLQSFGLQYRCEMCCNGFLTGTCDLTDSRCAKRANESEPTCVEDRIPQSDLSLIRDQAKEVICSTRKLEASQLAPSLLTTDILCGGVLYKQCVLGNSTGMCFNGRVAAVTCDVSGTFEKMRRLQVARSVGDPCDPIVEAWLGCES